METSSRMEDELRCPACRRLYVNPVQLPGCWHHLCYCCAVARIQPASSVSGSVASGLSSSGLPLIPALSSLSNGLSHPRLASSVSCQRVDDVCVKSSPSSSGSESCNGDADSDGLSVVSETDSGVIVVGNSSTISAGTGSRPGSCVGTPIPGSSSSTSLGKSTSSLSLQSNSSSGSSSNSHHSSSSQSSAYVIVCPTCSRVAPVDSNLASLPRPRALETIVDRFREARSLSVDCQICVSGASSGPSSPVQQQQQQQQQSSQPNPASRVCEPCELYFCDSCSHPEGGPYGADRHRVIGDVAEGRRAVQARHRDVDGRCVSHRDEQRSLYCLVCRATVCCVCVQQGRHAGHQTQPMGAMCRAQKVR
jgi:tripartite motif-containing protein 9/67